MEVEIRKNRMTIIATYCTVHLAAPAAAVNWAIEKKKMWMRDKKL